MLSAEHKKGKMKSSRYGNIFLLVSFENVLTGFTGATGRGRDTARLARVRIYNARKSLN